MRLVIGLVLSLTDMVTDIVMVVTYFKQDQNIFAYATIACVAVCIAIQAAVVLAQYQKASRQRQLFEVALVLSFAKPVLDTYRVCSGKEQDVEQTFDPLLELVLGKGTELIFESIPGSIIQTYAYISQDRSKRSTVALASLLTSMATTAYVSVSIAYDFDIDPSRRRKQPGMYGMIPAASSGRAAAFGSMFLLALTQVLGRTLACALLAAKSATLLVCILGGEMALYMLFKLLRRDFTYWMPIESKALSVLASVLMRSFRKILADVTGLLQERHAFEMTGIYFTLNMIWSQIFPYFAMQVYLHRDDDEEKESGLTQDELQTALIVLTLVWAASAASFAASIKRKYLRTFVSADTGSQYAIRLFRESETDEARFSAVFRNHRSYTAPIKAEVKAWLDERYPIWQLEHPPWFNDVAVASIPDDMLPKEVLRELIAKGGGARRRSSIGERLGGGERMIPAS